MRISHHRRTVAAVFHAAVCLLGWPAGAAPEERRGAEANRPPLEPADTTTVAAPEDGELPIVARPSAGAPLVGTAPANARLPVRGMISDGERRGCAVGRWYAL